MLWHPGVYSESINSVTNEGRPGHFAVTMAQMLHETEAAARTLGLELQLLAAQGPGDFDEAFAAMRRDGADALLLFPSPMLYLEHRRVVDVAKSSRLPAIYAAREFVDAGGLMSYGANLPALFRRTATYVDKIFRAPSPRICPWSSRPSSNSWSTCRPPRRWLSTFRRRCSLAPTR